jgi:hypothetical protein
LVEEVLLASLAVLVEEEPFPEELGEEVLLTFQL